MRCTGIVCKLLRNNKHLCSLSFHVCICKSGVCQMNWHQLNQVPRPIWLPPLLNWHLQIWKSHQGNLQAKANLTDMLPWSSPLKGTPAWFDSWRTCHRFQTFAKLGFCKIRFGFTLESAAVIILVIQRVGPDLKMGSLKLILIWNLKIWSKTILIEPDLIFSLIDQIDVTARNWLSSVFQS